MEFRLASAAMRPRILFVPIFAAFEATPFARRNTEWADVESFDGPGAGARVAEEAGGPEAVAAAGAERLDELGWESCVLVCDSHAQAAGVELAAGDPRVAGIAVSHAATHYTRTGERPALNASIYDTAAQLLATDHRSFARSLTQLTQGTLDDEWVDTFIDQVPRETARARMRAMPDGLELAIRLRDEDLEILLAGHTSCLMWTPEAIDDAEAALPQARVERFSEVPLSDERYHASIRQLCARVFG